MRFFSILIFASIAAPTFAQNDQTLKTGSKAKLQQITLIFLAAIACSTTCYADQTGVIESVQPRQTTAENLETTRAIEELLEDTRKAFVQHKRSEMYAEARNSVTNAMHRLNGMKAGEHLSESLADAKDTLDFYLDMLDAIEADVDLLEHRILAVC